MIETPDDLMDRIERTVDDMRPYIASHNGSVDIIDFDPDDGRLLVRFGGHCVGCAAASITLKQGLQLRLRETVPEVHSVEAV